MKKEEFIDRTLNCLFENHMPPGYEKARRKIRERFDASVEKAAWELYSYSPEDKAAVTKKLREAARQVTQEATKGAGEIEVGLLSPGDEDAEIERVFKASDKTRVLNRVRRYAEDQGYDVEEPPQGSESLLDWRFDGRRLTILRK